MFIIHTRPDGIADTNPVRSCRVQAKREQLGFNDFDRFDLLGNRCCKSNRVKPNGLIYFDLKAKAKIWLRLPYLCQGQNLALIVLCVPNSPDSGSQQAQEPPLSFFWVAQLPSVGDGWIIQLQAPK